MFHNQFMINHFSEQLKMLREQSGLKQRDIAESVGVIERTVSYWEQGRECDLDSLILIARFFEVTTDYLLGVGD